MAERPRAAAAGEIEWSSKIEYMYYCRFSMASRHGSSAWQAKKTNTRCHHVPLPRADWQTGSTHMHDLNHYQQKEPRPVVAPASENKRERIAGHFARARFVSDLPLASLEPLLPPGDLPIRNTPATTRLGRCPRCLCLILTTGVHTTTRTRRGPQ